MTPKRSVLAAEAVLLALFAGERQPDPAVCRE